jgi:hypothetical protein
MSASPCLFNTSFFVLEAATFTTVVRFGLPGVGRKRIGVCSTGEAAVHPADSIEATRTRGCTFGNRSCQAFASSAVIIVRRPTSRADVIDFQASRLHHLHGGPDISPAEIAPL